MDSTFYEKPELDFLMHYGKGHLDGGHSGRYPWGSGDDPYQRSYDWYTEVNKMKKDGKTEKDICEFFGLSSKQFIISQNISCVKIFCLLLLWKVT